MYEFQGSQVTDVYERASGNVKANKNVGDYYNVSLGIMLIRLNLRSHYDCLEGKNPSAFHSQHSTLYLALPMRLLSR